jgi:hypothetical protein
VFFQGTQNETVFPGLTWVILIAIILILVIWFSSGFLLSLWVRRDINRNELVGTSYIIIVLLTSIVGLSFYLIVRYNARCALEEDEAACAVDEMRKEIVQ